ncbi:MAG TPA: capsule assembly Wzi family protein [Terriglobales bacterium]|nr:capsule assembly Wzi family protein [Terriglobales bacterium]
MRTNAEKSPSVGRDCAAACGSQDGTTLVVPQEVRSEAASAPAVCRAYQSAVTISSLIILVLCGTLSAQNAQSSRVWSNAFNQPSYDGNYNLQPGADPENQFISPFVRHIAQDQKHFWTFPARLQVKDLKWIVPLAGGTAALIASDSWVSEQVPDRPGQLSFSKHASDYSLYSLIGAGGGALLLGSIKKNDHLQETGILSAEAALDATAVTYAIKVATQRQRPFVTNEDGDFFAGGPSSNHLSFPSEHSAIAWSIASIFAHEYPGPLTQVAAYGLATTVSAMRVTAKQHFPSDVIIGSLLGWYFGHEVFRAHHDPALGGSWGNYFEPSYEPKQRNPKNMGSPYVPPDSWVYPLFDRLAALGIVKTAYLGIRPWTRMECARLLEEAGEQIESLDTGNEAAHIYRELSEEFNGELSRLNGAPNLGFRLDSVYARATEIAGTPLTDGFHFAQTITNDYGRPYGQGFNTIAGMTAYAVAGPLSFSLQSEYQHAPAVPGYSANVQQVIGVADATTPFAYGRNEVNRVNVLNATVGMQFHNFEITAGKQSNWWSMTEGGPLLFSDNAEPIVGVKFDNVSPYHIPLLSSVLGDFRSEYFLGQLGGQTFEANVNQLFGPGGVDPQPFIQGLKVSFKPTQNLEVGFGFSAMFGGPGLPFTLHNFLRTFYSHTSNAATNPGKRLSAFDFSYRIPGLRNWLSIYRDSLAVDEYTPLTSSRPSMNIGLYMPKLPKLNKMDFRAEIIGTPHTTEFPPGFVYWDFRRYRSGYTNDGNLLASWIGRAGRGGQGWLTYWFSPRSTLQFGYRQQKVDRDFLEGGHLYDFSVRPQIMLNHNLNLSGTVQFEHWHFPILSASSRSNVMVQAQLTFFPHLRFRQ